MVVYTIMILLAMVMAFAFYRYKSANAIWGRPLAGIAGIIVAVLASIQIIDEVRGTASQRRQIVGQETNCAVATMAYLGKFLSKNYPGNRVLLISEPVSTSNKAREDNIIRSLKNRLQDKLTIIAHEFPPVSTSKGSTDHIDEPIIGYSFDFEILNKMLKRNPECDLVVSLIGMPVDTDNIKSWSKNTPNRPKLVAINADVSHLKPAIKNEIIAVAVTRNWSNAIDLSDDIPPIDDKEAFDRRYILINKNNIDLIAAAHPKLFAD